MTHLMLGSIKYQNPSLYSELVSLAEQLPNYKELARNYANRTRSDLNEEIFVTELAKYVSNKKNYSLPNSRDIIKTFHKIEEDLGVSYKEDFYKYIKYYESFYKKYNNKWYDVLLKNGSSLQDLDIEFNYIFPEPIFEYDRATIDITEARSLGDVKVSGLVAGSLEHSDHGYLFYHFEDKTYSFDLGFGYDSKSIAESIIKRCNSYRDFYQVDRTDEAYLAIVKTHSEIINKFIEGLKSL
jgi:hypothetical protein